MRHPAKRRPSRPRAAMATARGRRHPSARRAPRPRAARTVLRLRARVRGGARWGARSPSGALPGAGLPAGHGRAAGARGECAAAARRRAWSGAPAGPKIVVCGVNLRRHCATAPHRCGGGPARRRADVVAAAEEAEQVVGVGGHNARSRAQRPAGRLRRGGAGSAGAGAQMWASERGGWGCGRAGWTGEAARPGRCRAKASSDVRPRGNKLKSDMPSGSSPLYDEVSVLYEPCHSPKS